MFVQKHRRNQLMEEEPEEEVLSYPYCYICSEDQQPFIKVCGCGNAHELCLQTQVEKNFRQNNLVVKMNPYDLCEKIKGFYRCGGCSKGVVYELQNKFKIKTFTLTGKSILQTIGWTLLSLLFLFFLALWCYFSVGVLTKEIGKPSEERIFIGFIFCFTMSIIFTALLFLAVSFLAFYEGYLEPNYSASNIKFIRR